jgi:CheY-like chemotaxis protein
MKRESGLKSKHTTTSPMKKQSLKIKTILVIEDERPLLKVINARLGKDGFNVISARSVDGVFNAGIEGKDAGIIDAQRIQQALTYLEDLEKIDAIWLDHNLLGKEDGVDFIKKLRTNGKRWKKVPIFVVSNNESPQTMKSYASLGVRNYYIKSNHRLDEIIKDLNAFLDKNKV